MAYVAVADLRSETQQEFAAGVTLEGDEAPDTKLTAAIAAVSQFIDDQTHDHFEKRAGITLKVDVLEASGTVYLTQRCTAATTVSTRDWSGSLTAQLSTSYRFSSSLDAAGAYRVAKDARDFLEITYLGPGLSSTTYSPFIWPLGTQALEVIGDFGWTVTPRDIKRAVAVLVFDHFKNQRADLQRVRAIQTSSETIEYVRQGTQPGDSSTGIPEVDDILADYRRVTPMWAMMW